MPLTQITKLHKTQKVVAEDNHRFRVVNCGRRWGKTTLSILEMVAKAVSKNGRHIAYIAPTYQQARDIAWTELKKLCKPVIVTTNEARLEIVVKTQDGGTSTIWLRGWESIETLRGQRFDFIVIDEIAMMRKFWVNWQEVIRPTLTDSKGEVLFISTPKGFNHFYELYNTDDVDYKSFHYTTYDNPELTKEEIDKAKQEMHEDKFSQEYLADFRKQEGLIYKEFNRDLHIYDKEVTRVVETIAGVDFGFNNPTCVLHIKKDFDGVLWVDDEWYVKGRTEQQIADYIKSCKFNAIYPDPENPSAISVLNREGLPVREVKKGKDSVESGISQVRDMFMTNRLMINKNCQNLISELETYCTDEDGKIVKENDHALDALRYMVMSDIRKQAIDPFQFIKNQRERARNIRPNSV